MRNLILILLLSMGLKAEMSENQNDWYVVTDRVMGGSSNLDADYNDGTFKMTGNVVKKDGGFVRLAHRPETLSKDAKGIKFLARGNNETYEVHLTLKGVKMPPWSYMSKTFEVTEDWQEITINFDEFTKNGYMMASMKPSNIREFSIAGYGRDFDVDLEFKNVKVF
mgnify:FL=1|tara:strand:- start:1041 stop:1538 length:498 start_codon:yes stop_codon:yes gene_type:complete